MKKKGMLVSLLRITLILTLLCALCGLTVFAETKEAYDGDLMVADTGTVLVDQDVEGDLLGVAMEMQVNGVVHGNVRVAANSLTLNGRVERNVTVAAVELKTTQSLQAGDAVIIAGLAEIRGNFESLTIQATQVVIAGHISGELVCEADQVIILEGATFGSAKITSPNEPVVASDPSMRELTALSDSVSYRDGVEFTRTAGDFVVALTSLLYTLPAAILLAWVVVWVMKRSIKAAGKELKRHPFKYLLKGLGVFFLALFASIFLLANPWTMSFGGILLLLSLAVGIAGQAVTAAVLGRLWFFQKSPYVGATVVAAILAVLSLIPFLSMLVSLGTLAMSFGTVWYLFFNRRRDDASVAPDFRL